MNDYLDYNNSDHPYVPTPDPRQCEVVKRIKEVGTRIPQCVEDDDISASEVKNMIASATPATVQAAQPDWDETDESSGSFIKNKPFYESEESYRVNSSDSIGNTDYNYNIIENSMRYIGDEWIVELWIMDGIGCTEDHVVKTLPLSEIESASVVVYYNDGSKNTFTYDSYTTTGNMEIKYVSTTNSEEYIEFHKGSYSSPYTKYGFSNKTDIKEIRIIVGTSVVKLDEKYIPDTIARVSDTTTTGVSLNKSYLLLEDYDAFTAELATSVPNMHYEDSSITIYDEDNVLVDTIRADRLPYSYININWSNPENGTSGVDTLVFTSDTSSLSSFNEAYQKSYSGIEYMTAEDTLRVVLLETEDGLAFSPNCPLFADSITLIVPTEESIPDTIATKSYVDQKINSVTIETYKFENETSELYNIGKIAMTNYLIVKDSEWRRMKTGCPVVLELDTYAYFPVITSIFTPDMLTAVPGDDYDGQSNRVARLYIITNNESSLLSVYMVISATTYKDVATSSSNPFPIGYSEGAEVAIAKLEELGYFDIE